MKRLCCCWWWRGRTDVAILLTLPPFLPFYQSWTDLPDIWRPFQSVLSFRLEREFKVPRRVVLLLVCCFSLSLSSKPNIFCNASQTEKRLERERDFWFRPRQSSSIRYEVVSVRVSFLFFLIKQYLLFLYFFFFLISRTQWIFHNILLLFYPILSVSLLSILFGTFSSRLCRMFELERRVRTHAHWTEGGGGVSLRLRSHRHTHTQTEISTTDHIYIYTH